MSPAESAVLEAIAARRVAGSVLVIALDGEGAAGKTTLAEHIGARAAAAVVHTDDFFREMPWERRRSLAPARGVSQYYDLARLREQALLPLRSGQAARYAYFDWCRADRPVGERIVEPAELVVLEGVCSACPELADLVDLAVYVATDESTRRRRLLRRVMAEEWDARWLAAERVYFSGVRPRSSFDLAVPGTAVGIG